MIKGNVVKVSPEQWDADDEGITFFCPGCNCLGTLDHSVNKKGNVSPSVICALCGWHGHIQLLNWKGGEYTGLPETIDAVRETTDLVSEVMG